MCLKEYKMPTKYVVEIKEDILNDVLEYAKAQKVEPYVWIEQLIRRNIKPEDPRV